MTLLSVYQPFFVAGVQVLAVWSVLIWSAHKVFDMATPSPGGRSDDD